ncbi:MAG: patatin-like phospholipase family protein [Caldilineaceae bacterium]
MATIDMVFEGGGAKGMAFVGALRELFQHERVRVGRLLGTSSGAIMATLLAAGYTVKEMEDALVERDENGRPVFESFMGDPATFSRETIDGSAIRTVLRNMNLPVVGGGLEEKIDDAIVSSLVTNELFRHIFSFVEQGGWYSAEAFVRWLQNKLNTGSVDGIQRRYGESTLKQFFETTGKDLTLIAADTTGQRMLILNHRTAPDVPVVRAARMSMSIPLLWQEVIWQEEWGPYLFNKQEHDLTGHAIVDGGLLSTFPISLFLSDREDVMDVMGEPTTDNVLGVLIDEAKAVPGKPATRASTQAVDLGALRTARRFRRIVDTALSAHDRMAIELYKQNIVRLPAKGYGTTQFDMTDEERSALVNAAADAMREFLQSRMSLLETAGEEFEFSAAAPAVDLANTIAGEFMNQ